jgi:NADH dehydrogenase FAD-containing subunit
MERPHSVVVIVGSFAGRFAVRVLKRDPIPIALVDRNNFRLFTPLPYEVATGALLCKCRQPIAGTDAMDLNLCHSQSVSTIDPGGKCGSCKSNVEIPV